VVFIVKTPAMRNQRLAQNDSGDRTAAALMRGVFGNVGHGGAL
jgi:hypothetical protein